MSAPGAIPNVVQRFALSTTILFKELTDVAKCVALVPWCVSGFACPTTTLTDTVVIDSWIPDELGFIWSCVDSSLYVKSPADVN